jgi:hypothetical protein
MHNAPVLSWPGLSRPSTSLNWARTQGVDARHKAGHDESKGCELLPFPKIRPRAVRPATADSVRGFSPRPKNKKGRAGRRGFADPHGLVQQRKSTRVVFRRSRVFPKRPARDVLGLLRTNPGGVTRPSFWERPLYPPLDGISHRKRRMGYERPRPRDPHCGARPMRAGHRTAWAAGGRLRCLPAGHRHPAPPHETPSGRRPFSERG